MCKFYNSHTGHLKDFLPRRKDAPLSPMVVKLYNAKQYWERIRATMQHKKNNQELNWKEHRYFDTSVIKLVSVSQGFCILHHVNDIKYVFDYDQVMLISDNIASRCYVYWYFNTCVDFGNVIPEKDLNEIYSIFDTALIKKGNIAYDDIKMWEPILQGVILTQYDNLKFANRFLRTINQNIKSDGLGYAEQMSKYIEGKRYSIYQLGELHGMYRHWGHPHCRRGGRLH